MATFFTADTHFGHGGALGLFRRPFASVAAMDAGLVERWNAVVGPEDEVWHLGDFAVGAGADRVDALLQQLHGRKHLVTGNNDGPATVAARGWSSVQPYAETEENGVLLILCHYAFRTWRRMDRGSWNLHGHSHGRLPGLLRQCDVGVDPWAFRPVAFAQVVERAAARRRERPR